MYSISLDYNFVRFLTNAYPIGKLISGPHTYIGRCLSSVGLQMTSLQMQLPLRIARNGLAVDAAGCVTAPAADPVFSTYTNLLQLSQATSKPLHALLSLAKHESKESEKDCRTCNTYTGIFKQGV